MYGVKEKSLLTVVILILVLGACNNASLTSDGPKYKENIEQENSGPSPYVAEDLNHKVITKQEASAFLSRSTFGAIEEEIQALVSLGDYEPWFETQFEQNPSLHLSWAEAHAKGINGVSNLKSSPEDWYIYRESLTLLQRDAWWDIVVNGRDQLRQRVAYALSEILVISRLGPLVGSADARMSYYDVLVSNAFGNFEDLLREVTYHPAMGGI